MMLAQLYTITITSFSANANCHRPVLLDTLSLEFMSTDATASLGAATCPSQQNSTPDAGLRKAKALMPVYDLNLVLLATLL